MVNISGSEPRAAGSRNAVSAASSPSREALWLRFVGMGLMLGGFVAAACLGEAVDPLPLLENSDWSRVAPWATLSVIAANGIVLGLILLLAGLRQVSLRTRTAESIARHRASGKIDPARNVAPGRTVEEISSSPEAHCAST
jgi:hypothetical protein